MKIILHLFIASIVITSCVDNKQTVLRPNTHWIRILDTINRAPAKYISYIKISNQDTIYHPFKLSFWYFDKQQNIEVDHASRRELTYANYLKSLKEILPIMTQDKQYANLNMLDIPNHIINQQSIKFDRLNVKKLLIDGTNNNAALNYMLEHSNFKKDLNHIFHRNGYTISQFFNEKTFISNKHIFEVINTSTKDSVTLPDEYFIGILSAKLIKNH